MNKYSLDDILDTATMWARNQKSIVGAMLVGSHARGTPGPNSDIDFIFFTDDYSSWFHNLKWLEEFGTVERTSVEDWGPVKSIRAFFKGGLEVEFSFGKLSWASLNPIDPGTLRVVSNGAKVLYDPTSSLEKLLNAAKSHFAGAK